MEHRRPAPRGVAVNGAVSQWDRWVRAGQPAEAPVDGRSLEDLLAFAPRFGELLRYYDLADRVDGDWRDFFLADPLVVLAAMAADDPGRDEAAYRRLLRRARREGGAEERWELLRQGFRLVAERARRMDGWLRGLLAGADRRGARGLHRQLRALVAGEVGEAVRRVAGWDRGATEGGLATSDGSPAGGGAGRAGGRASRVGGEAGTGEGEGRRGGSARGSAEGAAGQDAAAAVWFGFDPAWKLDAVAPDPSVYGSGPAAARALRVLERLGEPLEVLLDASLMLRPDARDGLGEVGDDLAAGDMRPQLALYVAFARLFGDAQATVNTVSARLRRFYDRDVLREPARGPRPDQVFLTFALAQGEGVAATTVPAGTLFPAGEDAAGREILFAAARSLRVSATAVADVRMVRRVDGPLLVGAPAPSPAAGATVPRQVLATRVAAANPGDAIEPADAPGWATFGAATSTAGAGSLGGSEEAAVEDAEATGAVTAAASLGFAVASPYLLLVGGDRTVGLVFSFRLSPVAQERLDALAAATGLTAGEALTQVLAGAFRLFLSTPAGWFPVASYQVTEVRQGGQPAWRLALHLPSSVPPVVPLGQEVEAVPGQVLGEGEVSDDPVVTASNPAPALPTVKGYLVAQPAPVAGDAGEVAVYPYSILEALQTAAVQVLTSVDGLADLRVRNTDGEVDPSAPFPVFGGVPQVDGYLELASAELFAKVPQELRVTVHWLGLPPNDTGFLGWYRDYTLGLDGKPSANGEPLFDNAKFEGAFAVETPGLWELAPAAPGPLFRAGDDCAATPPPDAPLCPRTVFDLPVAATGQPAPPYYRPAGSALRLSLTAPDYAFGNDLYSINVLNSVVRDLPSGSACGERCLALCQPLQDASTQLLVCITECGQEGGACQSCLDALVDRLLLAAVESFLRCLRSRGADLVATQGLDPQLPRVLETRVRGCTALPRRERLRCLRQSREEARELLAEGSGWSCFEIFDALVVAILGIELARERCRTSDGTVDPACLAEALGECRAGLDTAYAACLQGCADDCMQPPQDLRYPNDPYLPQAQSVSVAYKARCTIPLAGAAGEAGGGAGASPCGSVFQLTPFDGYREAVGSGPDVGAPGPVPFLLAPVPREGNLLLGLAPYGRGQTLDLLFRLATVDVETPASDVAVEWSWLAADGWRELGEHALLADGTQGLRSTGIVALELPAAPYPLQTAGDEAASGVPSTSGAAGEGDAAAHLLPRDRFWLRAAVAGDAGRFPRTVSIRPHALVATRRPTATEPEAGTAQVEVSAAGSLPGPVSQPRPVLQGGVTSGAGTAAASLRAGSGLGSGGAAAPGIFGAPRGGRTEGAPLGAGEVGGAVGSAPEAGLAVPQPVFEPLPAGTITAAVQDLPQIGSVVQPLPSFGGRPAEVGAAYDLRLAERLRHKERAIQPWDYQRLVLERFPEVWQVAVLPATDADGRAAPGHVLAVVVAGELGNESSDVTVPRLRGELLGRIHDFLAERASPFVTLAVVNPVYVRLTAHAQVVFRSGSDGSDDDDEPAAAAPADRLDRDLVAWLSPWFYDAARAARQGRYTSEADVAEFIRSRPYVESLVRLELTPREEEIRKPWYYLTSALRHDVEAVTGDECHPRRRP